MSRDVDHPYCCCYADGGRDAGGVDDDDTLWTRRSGVCAVRSSRCGLVMWNDHETEIFLCDVNGDDFLS